jgi:hypothetical protein
MAVLKIRTACWRLVLVAGLALMVMTGSFAVNKPSHAAAAPMTCARAKGIAYGYAAIANVMWASGASMEADYYWAMGGVYYDYC